MERDLRDEWDPRDTVMSNQNFWRGEEMDLECRGLSRSAESRITDSLAGGEAPPLLKTAMPFMTKPRTGTVGVNPM